MENILSSVIIYPLTQIIEFAYVFFFRIFKNPGIAVIGVSLAVTLLCLPLYIVAEKWQEIQRNTESKLKPRVDRIKKAFKGDEQYMMLNTYYKQQHYHPLMALRSSFGLLIQIPFFIAAYGFLSNMQALRGQSFLFIRDMGAPDALFMIGNFGVNILPIAMTLINIIAGAIYTKGFAAKEKIQIYAMALVFLVLLYNSPAGLVLYWTMNNFFSLVKNIFYKIKNPLKVLYVLLCIVVIFVDIYLIFFTIQSPRVFYLRVAGVLCFTSLIFIPFILKFVNYLLCKVLKPLVENDKLRFQIFIFVAIACALLTGLVLPSLLVSSSVQEFSDIANRTSPNFYVWNTFIQSIGLFIFWPTCIYFLFKARIQNFLILILSSFLLCGVVNAFAFVGDYGSMNQWLNFTDAVNTGKLSEVILNIFTNLIIFVAIIFAFRYINKFIHSFFLICCIAFFSFGIINLNLIQTKYKEHTKLFATNKTEIKTEIQKEFSLSKTGQNVVVIMLDRQISSFIDSIFEETPSLYDIYDGFTYYKNCVSYNGHTVFGSTPLYGGYEYTPFERLKFGNKPLVQQHNEALLVMPRIFTEQANFSATIADASWANFVWFSDMHITDPYPLIDGKNLRTKYNFAFEQKYPELKPNPTLIDKVLQRDFLWISLFRQSPLFIRPFIYYSGNWWSSSKSEKRSPYPDFYSELEFLPEMTDFENNQNSFIYFVNELPHERFPLQAPDYVPVKEVTNLGNSKYSTDSYYAVNAASILKVGQWLNFLKENNCYDNTKIIIVSDHGGNTNAENENYDEPYLFTNGKADFAKDTLHPTLLVKDFNTHGKFKTDTTFMTNADVPTIAFKDIIKKPINPFTQNIITDEIKHSKGAIVLTLDLWHPDEMTKPFPKLVKDAQWITVKENIFKSENWQGNAPVEY